MFIITVTRWKRKLALLLVGVVFVVSLGLGLSWFFNSPANNTTTAPSDDLKKDVMTQPVKVQAPKSK